MQLFNSSSIDIISAYLFFIGCLGIFVWLAIVIYLNSKWLTLLEDILEDGVRLYSLNILFSAIGVLHYATVFLWTFHAKRYGMLEKRNNVPKHIKKWFIFAFFWFITNGLLMAISIFIS